jgi:hypothetical protein
VNHLRTPLSTSANGPPFGTAPIAPAATTTNAVASQQRISSTAAYIDLTDDGPSLINSWISAAERQVKEAALVVAPGGGPFDMDVPNSHEAGIALLLSLRRLLRERRTPSIIAGFATRLPEDVANYLHAGASYVMCVIYCLL